MMEEPLPSFLDIEEPVFEIDSYRTYDDYAPAVKWYSSRKMLLHKYISDRTEDAKKRKLVGSDWSNFIDYRSKLYAEQKRCEEIQAKLQKAQLELPKNGKPDSKQPRKKVDSTPIKPVHSVATSPPEGEFTLVTKGPKHREAQVLPPIQTENPYASLSEDVTMETEQATALITPKTAKTKMPPIFIKDDRFPWPIVKETLQKMNITEFTGRYRKDCDFTIYMSDEHSYASLIEFLDRNTISYHTHMMKNKRPIKAVIKGIPDDTTTEELQMELTRLGFTTIKIDQMTSRRSGELKKLSMYLVTLPQSDANKGIFKLQFLMKLCIKVEKYKNKKGPRQCMRCQGFSHTHFTCRHPPKCGHCAADHLSSECDAPTTQKPLCVNCHGDHASTDKDCPRRPKPPAPTLTTKITSTRTYAQAVKSSPAQKADVSSPAQEITPDLLHQLTAAIKLLQESGLLDALCKLAGLAPLLCK